MQQPSDKKIYNNVSTESLINALKGEGISRNKYLANEYLYNDNSQNPPFWTFKGLNVGSLIIAGGYNLESPKLKFIDCKISQIHLSNLRENSLDNFIIQSSIIESIIIKNSIVGDITINGNSEIGDLHFIDQSSIRNIIVDEKSYIKNLLIKNTSILNLDVLNKSTIHCLTISSNAVGNIVTINDSSTEDLLIYNSKFKAFNFENKSSVGSVEIKDNPSMGDVNISQSEIQRFIVFNSITKSFLINEESLTGDFDIYNSEIEYILIENKSKIGDFKVNISNIEKIKISNNSQSNNFNINKNSIIGNINILDNSLCGYFNFIDSVVKEFSIKNKCTIRDILINKSTQDKKHGCGEFNIDDSTVENIDFFEMECDEVVIAKSIVGEIKIKKATIKRQLYISSNSKIYKLWIQGKDNRRIVLQKSYIQNLEWKQDTFCMMNIEECEIEFILFERCAIPKDSVFQISATKVNTLIFSLFTNTAWLNFIHLQPLRNYKRFKESLEEGEANEELDNNIKHVFENSNKEDGFYLINSDLGKTSFINCELDQFSNFVFNSSKMLEVFVGGTQLPVKINSETIDTKRNDYELKRLAFGQFKKIYDNRGDNVRANKFLALELESYRKQLSKSRENWSEQFNLWLNKFSSDYGNNWFQAVKVTIGVTLFCFWIYCMALGYGIGTDIDKMFDLLSYSPEFLNPLRKADFLKNSHGEYLVSLNPIGNEGFARFWDYLSRIFISYFVYQTIQAFRRFGKTK